MKSIPKSQRSFLTCNDCRFYTRTEWLDEARAASKGTCDKDGKVVINHWETDCKDHSDRHECQECRYFSDVDDWDDADYDEDMDDEDRCSTWCSWWGSDPNHIDTVCSKFNPR